MKIKGVLKVLKHLIWMFGLFFGCLIIGICYVQRTGVEKIKTLPKYCEKNCNISEIADYGNGHYVIRIENATENGYEKYLKQLEYAGFKKGDFRIDGDIIVEVGGQDKGFGHFCDHFAQLS